jgi:hypothetical protein
LLTSMLIVFMLRENNTEAPKFNNGRVIISRWTKPIQEPMVLRPMGNKQ